MDDNVFGVPILDGTLTERVRKALVDPNANGKRDAALAYVRKRKYDWGQGISTLGIFYNATGEPMSKVNDNNAFGHIDGRYPTIVQNGQWGAFFHVKNTAAASGSEGFVLYHVMVNDKKSCNMLIAWSNPWSKVSYNNLAYCDILDEDNTDPKDVYKNMEEHNKPEFSAVKFGMIVSSSIDSITSPLYQAEFSREDMAMEKSVKVDVVTNLKINMA